MAAQANPLVTRSPTWGRAGDAAALPGPGSPVASAAPNVQAPWRPYGTPPTYGAQPSYGNGPAFPPASQPIQPPRRVEDSDWRSRIFRN